MCRLAGPNRCLTIRAECTSAIRLRITQHDGESPRPVCGQVMTSPCVFAAYVCDAHRRMGARRSRCTSASTTSLRRATSSRLLVVDGGMPRWSATKPRADHALPVPSPAPPIERSQHGSLRAALVGHLSRSREFAACRAWRPRPGYAAGARRGLQIRVERRGYRSSSASAWAIVSGEPSAWRCASTSLATRVTTEIAPCDASTSTVTPKVRVVASVATSTAPRWG